MVCYRTQPRTNRIIEIRQRPTFGYQFRVYGINPITLRWYVRHEGVRMTHRSARRSANRALDWRLPSERRRPRTRR